MNFTSIASAERRALLGAGLASAGLLLPGLAQAKSASSAAHVVIVGGGVGGATTAKYLRLFSPQLQITLVEQNPVYIRPYGSSEVLNQHVTMQDLEVRYDTLVSKYGIKLVVDKAVSVDGNARTLKLASGQSLTYDRLVVSPGIELMYDKLPGYSRDIAETKIPSGWIPGSQTALLAKQLQAMRQGGTFLIVAPPNPYRCPPGPYERGALMTEWFQKHNPTAKVIIVDPKDGFVTDETAMLGWNRLYGFQMPKNYAAKMSSKVEIIDHAKPGKIEWIPLAQGGRAVKVDAKAMTVTTEGDTVKADVINIIPPMRAGHAAQALGLADNSGFCPINRTTFESTLIPHVHVIGDASIADVMPKSGFSANTQGKVVAYAITELLAGRTPPSPVMQNTCYALAGKDYGLFVADVFRVKDDKIVRVNGKERYLPLDANKVQIRLAAQYQQAWIRVFTQDIFA